MLCRNARADFGILLCFRQVFALALLLIVVAVLSACSRSGPSKNISVASFDSAPAEIKKTWSDGMAAWKSHRYQQAATSFVSLQNASNLLPQQKEDLSKALDEFGQEAFVAANKGDADATKAVQTLRRGGRRSGNGQ